jgi:hypothetical protein
MKNNTYILILLLAGLALIGNAKAKADVVISDDFAGRKPGTALSGSPTKTGNKTWVADSRFVFGEADGSSEIILKEAGSVGLGIPFSFTEVKGKGDVVTVSLTAVINGGWLAVNFGRGAETHDFLPKTKFWLLQNPNGGWQLRDSFALGREPVILARGEASVTPGAPVHLSLSYNETAGEIVDFSINGKSVISGITFTSLREWPVSGISIFINNGKTNTRIRNFMVSVTKAEK